MVKKVEHEAVQLIERYKAHFETIKTFFEGEKPECASYVMAKACYVGIWDEKKVEFILSKSEIKNEQAKQELAYQLFLLEEELDFQYPVDLVNRLVVVIDKLQELYAKGVFN